MSKVIRFTLHGKQAEAFVRYRDTDYHLLHCTVWTSSRNILRSISGSKAASKTDSQIVYIWENPFPVRTTGSGEPRHIVIGRSGDQYSVGYLDEPCAPM